jgi:hypothetical protein
LTPCTGTATWSAPRCSRTTSGSAPPGTRRWSSRSSTRPPWRTCCSAGGRFSGRLPQSWPTSQAQEPINVGDANYQPLYPFGWGIATGAQQGRLAAVRSVAQQAMIAGRAAPDAAALFALAEQAELAGQPELAARLLLRVVRR